MRSINRKLTCGLAPMLLAYGTAAFAQEKPAGYPVRPIRIIIGVAAGAGADMVARTTAQILTERWGQNVVVEPRPGGGGVIASENAAKAAPDGYTLYQSGFGLLYQGATKRVPFDVLKSVAHEHVPYLPTSLMLAGSWDNIESLAAYGGPIEVFGAERDPVIPVEHARKLAASRPQATFHLVPGGHMDWVDQPEVLIHNP